MRIAGQLGRKSMTPSIVTAAAVSRSDLRLAPDFDLIKLSITGRNDAFEELVMRYQRPIVGYIFRIVKDYDASLDVAQEVFIKVYSSLDKYCSDYKFSTWLYRIAHNASIDHLRRKSNLSQSIDHNHDEDGVFAIQVESNDPPPEQARELSEWRCDRHPRAAIAPRVLGQGGRHPRRNPRGALPRGLSCLHRRRLLLPALRRHAETRDRRHPDVARERCVQEDRPERAH